ncbi:hypothetical protein SGA01_56930 [Streptomyces gardneri]|uniref:Uncharacterized protein n=1 Tax=Streptomyces gardneri TaxID=66892 RepID=A0A4Y3RSN3_9ACTN|nr:hypothetical protein SGA01_56930 [Streptomyces gardneri]
MFGVPVVLVLEADRCHRDRAVPCLIGQKSRGQLWSDHPSSLPPVTDNAASEHARRRGPGGTIRTDPGLERWLSSRDVPVVEKLVHASELLDSLDELGAHEGMPGEVVRIVDREGERDEG